jgi:murein DD-endopeptidase MepM/ murein hydrolase activator NlpD
MKQVSLSLSPISYSHQLLRDTLQEEAVVRTRQTDGSEQDEKKLEEACAEFESLFIYQIMKQMRKTIVKSGLTSGGKGEEIFTSMMDEEISKQVSLRQGLGLRDALIEQLTGKRGRVLPRSIAIQTYGENQTAGEGGQPFVLPVFGSISSAYGWRNDPFTGKPDFHHGIDIASPYGSEVFAAGAGRVVFSGWREGYGKVVEIEHQDGASTLYAHNSKNLVKEGEMVARNQPIALVGSSGKSTGPHLHYEVRKSGEAINPTELTHIVKGRWYANRF